MGCFTGLHGVAEALAVSLARVTGHLPPTLGQDAQVARIQSKPYPRRIHLPRPLDFVLGLIVEAELFLRSYERGGKIPPLERKPGAESYTHPLPQRRMSWDLSSKVLYLGSNTAPLNPRATLRRDKHFRRASQVHGYRLPPPRKRKEREPLARHSMQKCAS